MKKLKNILLLVVGLFTLFSFKGSEVIYQTFTKEEIKAIKASKGKAKVKVRKDQKQVWVEVEMPTKIDDGHGKLYTFLNKTDSLGIFASEMCLTSYVFTSFPFKPA